jgi:translation initiation factor 3 subunit B
MASLEPEDDGFDEEEPQLDTSFKETIIVDGLPVVPAEKREKLINVIRKFFSQVGTITTLTMPQGPDNSSLGFAFIEFSSEAEANAAIARANGYKLDKSHTFIVNAFDDYSKYSKVPDEEVEFTPPEFTPSENVHSWLMDENARDQYVCRYNDETEIWWNDPTKPNQEPAYARKNWSDSYVSWSPRGTYLATFHRLGIMLWGGASWKKLLKLNHGGVKLIDFSPCERFVVTWSPETDQANAVIVWDVTTGQKMRSFQGSKPDEQMEWPVFRWSHDDQFFARLGDDCIYVYESVSMKLIKDRQDKRSSVKVDGVRQFLWSPTDNIVSLWVPEHTNNPAKVVLMELPSRNELRQKNLFSVADLRMTWHDQGHFLCVKVVGSRQ